jgi:hypothetical protein
MQVVGIRSIGESWPMFTLGFLAAAMVILGPCIVLYLGRSTPHVIENLFWGLYLLAALVSAAGWARSHRSRRFASDRDRWARFMLGSFSFVLVLTVVLTLFWLAQAFVARYDGIVEGMRRAGMAHANCT